MEGKEVGTAMPICQKKKGSEQYVVFNGEAEDMLSQEQANNRAKAAKNGRQLTEKQKYKQVWHAMDHSMKSLMTGGTAHLTPPERKRKRKEMKHNKNVMDHASGVMSNIVFVQEVTLLMLLGKLREESIVLVNGISLPPSVDRDAVRDQLHESVMREFSLGRAVTETQELGDWRPKFECGQHMEDWLPKCRNTNLPNLKHRGLVFKTDLYSYSDYVNTIDSYCANDEFPLNNKNRFAGVFEYCHAQYWKIHEAFTQSLIGISKAVKAYQIKNNVLVVQPEDFIYFMLYKYESSPCVHVDADALPRLAPFVNRILYLKYYTECYRKTNVYMDGELVTLLKNPSLHFVELRPDLKVEIANRHISDQLEGLQILSLSNPAGQALATQANCTVLDFRTLNEVMSMYTYMKDNKPAQTNYFNVGNARDTGSAKFIKDMSHQGVMGTLPIKMFRGSCEDRMVYQDAAKKLDDIITKKVRQLVGIDNVEIDEYQATCMITDPKTYQQKFHRDYRKSKERKVRAYSAIIPVTEAGSFIAVCPGNENGEKQGRILFIPYGYGILFDSDMVHAGGYLTCPEHCNLRLHLYIVPNGAQGKEDHVDYLAASEQKTELHEIITHQYSERQLLETGIFK